MSQILNRKVSRIFQANSHVTALVGYSRGIPRRQIQHKFSSQLLSDNRQINRTSIFTHIRIPNLIRFHSSDSSSENHRGDISSNGNGRKRTAKELSDIVVPVPVRVTSNPDDINVGQELAGSKLKKQDLLRVLNQFFQRQPIKELAREQGLDQKLFNSVHTSFRKWCVEQKVLPTELHIVFSDILQEHGHPDDLFPFFMGHARQIYPHLECLEELKKVSDLTQPPNWYPEARAMTRKIIFHCGPTNSGKTYHALKRFFDSKSGIYCGPLKLLAVEVFNKANAHGTPCDLVTGEERRLADPAGEKESEHMSCTVEMSPVTTPFEVAVIDEIQMLRDPQRGWAWTRALLGICAEEIHLCGEEAALDVLRDILEDIGEEVQVHKYDRLTGLTIEDKALTNLNRVQNGDCIVCFSKAAIYNTSLQLERMGKEVAVIYGSLPPGTKLLQAEKFNDPNDPTNILVATDAIGMGLNLSIRRIIFHSITKPYMNDKGEKEIDLITTSQALQIAGRAGRFNSQYGDGGFVTTLKDEDLPVLKQLLSKTSERVVAVGLAPTSDQIELFAYHLPNATLSNLLDIFVSLCQVNESSYFMCNIEPFKVLADMIQHVPLPLRARYEFCCAPINNKMPFVCTMFLKFTRQYSNNEPITLNWLCSQVGWPPKTPSNLQDLMHLEQLFDVFDLYLWLSYRFMDLFPDPDPIRELQKELDEIINEGVSNITKLLRNTDTPALENVARFSEEHVRKDGGQPRPKASVSNIFAAMMERTSQKGKPSYSSGKKHLYDPDMAELAKLVKLESNQDTQRMIAQIGKETSQEDYYMKMTVVPRKLRERLVADGTLSPELMEMLKKELEAEIIAKARHIRNYKKDSDPETN